MSGVCETSRPADAVIAPGLPVFLPTTSPISGGLMLRVHRQRPPDLLLPNPYGAGVLVAQPDRLDDFGFSPSAFDRVMLRRVVARSEIGMEDLRDCVRVTALSGFAGREAQTLTREVGGILDERRERLRAEVRRLLKGRATDPGQAESLVQALIQTGLTVAGAGDFLRNLKNDRASSGVIPPRLALFRSVVSTLSDTLPADYTGVSAGRCQCLAQKALERMETVFRQIAGLLLAPARLAALKPETGLFSAELAVLPGWNRFCLMTREVKHAPCRVHAVAGMTGLAQVLSHGRGGEEPTSGGYAVRPGQAAWPREIDHDLYLTERNERFLRAEIALDVKEI